MEFLAAVIYRVKQFFQALGARICPGQIVIPNGYLSQEQQALFGRMSPADQLHSLKVFHTLREQGYHEADLLVAALLHDIGKAVGPLPLLHRVAIVLFRDGRWERWASPNPHSWRYPFFVYQQHAVAGARLAQAAGCSPLTVELIRGHHRPPHQCSNDLSRYYVIEEELLIALWEADEAN